jgi:hypothetical protein
MMTDEEFVSWLDSNGFPIEPELAFSIKERLMRDSGEMASFPDKCPITRRDFFMVIEHPELGMVPTYGGPYDSFTIPHMMGEPDVPFHERELECHRYDHDVGGWVDDGSIPMRVIYEPTLDELKDDRAAERMRFLHTSNLVDGYEYGVFKVKWKHGRPDEVLHVMADNSDLDVAIAKVARGDN